MVNMFHNIHKAPGGLIRADFEIRDGAYQEVCLSGDWFCYPREAAQALELKIQGATIEKLQFVIEEFYGKYRVETPGITVDDWLTVLAAWPR